MGQPAVAVKVSNNATLASALRHARLQILKALPRILQDSLPLLCAYCKRARGMSSSAGTRQERRWRGRRTAVQQAALGPAVRQRRHPTCWPPVLTLRVPAAERVRGSPRRDDDHAKPPPAVRLAPCKQAAGQPADDEIGLATGGRWQQGPCKQMGRTSAVECATGRSPALHSPSDLGTSQMTSSIKARKKAAAMTRARGPHQPRGAAAAPPP